MPTLNNVQLIGHLSDAPKLRHVGALRVAAVGGDLTPVVT